MSNKIIGNLKKDGKVYELRDISDWESKKVQFFDYEGNPVSGIYKIENETVKELTREQGKDSIKELSIIAAEDLNRFNVETWTPSLIE